MAATDYFLRIDGISGESADAKHKGEIDVESFAWGETGSGSIATGGGGGEGKVSMDDFAVTARTSKASPQLLLACATGKHFKSAVLTARRAGGKNQLEYLTFSLTDLMVSDYHIAGSDDGAMDAVALRFARIQVEYSEQKADGSAGPSTKAGYDLKTRKSI
jgi:type VI secretion system secreted protein Hcp